MLRSTASHYFGGGSEGKTDVWKYDVEKILAIRKARLPVTDEGGDHECLVKFKHMSHRRARWKKESQVVHDHSGDYFLKRVRSKMIVHPKETEATDCFSPEWLVVDRVVAVQTFDWVCSDESDMETSEIIVPKYPPPVVRKRKPSAGKKTPARAPAKLQKKIEEEEEEMEIVTVLVCDGCEAELTLREVGLEEAPEGDWFCPACVKRDLAISAVSVISNRINGSAISMTETGAATAAVSLSETNSDTREEASGKHEETLNHEEDEERGAHEGTSAPATSASAGTVVAASSMSKLEESHDMAPPDVVLLPPPPPVPLIVPMVTVTLHDEASIERVKRQCANPGTKVTKYLVKWRGLGYGSCTWESEETVLKDMGAEGVSILGALTAPQLLLKFKDMHLSICSQVSPESTFAVSNSCSPGSSSSCSLSTGTDPNRFRILPRYSGEDAWEAETYTEVFVRDVFGVGVALQPTAVTGNEASRAVTKVGVLKASLNSDSAFYEQNRAALLTKVLDQGEVTVIQHSGAASGMPSAVNTPGDSRIIIPISSVVCEQCSAMQLKGYQIQGVKWLLFQYCSGRGSILGDEMGLGKTIQALAWTETLRYYGCIATRLLPMPTGTQESLSFSALPPATTSPIPYVQPGIAGGSNLKPVLIIAPLSTLANWQREISSFTTGSAVIFHGNQGDREQFERYEFLKAVDSTTGKMVLLPKFHYLISSYEMALQEAKFLHTMEFSIVIIDEGHRLKNMDAQARACIQLMKCENRLILTGTPIQNNLSELFSLLNLINPLEFPSREKFLAKYDSLIGNVGRQKQKSVLKTSLNHCDKSGSSNTSSAMAITTKSSAAMSASESLMSLQDLLKKYLLRREKADVDLTIPEKMETIIHVELTLPQKQYYRALLERNKKFLSRGSDGKKANGQLNNILMQLRKVCNHPFILEGGREAIKEDMRRNREDYTLLSTNRKTRNGKCEDKTLAAIRADPLIASCGKFVLLHKLIPKLLRERSKCLIFSQFNTGLDMIAEYLFKYYGNIYERIDGRVSASTRQAAINRFNAKKTVDPTTNMYTDNSSMIFLLTTRAGGVGINLQAANTVIIFDSDWNPHQDVQAISRAHRMGQTDEVKVYRLLSRNSVESVLFSRASSKLKLAEKILKGVQHTDLEKDSAFTDKDRTDDVILSSVVRQSAIKILTEEDHAAATSSSKFMDRTIESILQDDADNMVYSEKDGKYRVLPPSSSGVGTNSGDTAAGTASSSSTSSSAAAASGSKFSSVVLIPDKKEAANGIAPAPMDVEGEGTEDIADNAAGCLGPVEVIEKAGVMSELDVEDLDFWEKALPKDKTKIGKILKFFTTLVQNGPDKFTTSQLHRQIKKTIVVSMPVYKARQAGEVTHDDMDDVLELLRLILDETSGGEEKTKESVRTDVDSSGCRTEADSDSGAKVGTDTADGCPAMAVHEDESLSATPTVESELDADKEGFTEPTASVGAVPPAIDDRNTALDTGTIHPRVLIGDLLPEADRIKLLALKEGILNPKRRRATAILGMGCGVRNKFLSDGISDSDLDDEFELTPGDESSGDEDQDQDDFVAKRPLYENSRTAVGAVGMISNMNMSAGAPGASRNGAHGGEQLRVKLPIAPAIRVVPCSVNDPEYHCVPEATLIACLDQSVLETTNIYMVLKNALMRTIKIVFSPDTDKEADVLCIRALSRMTLDDKKSLLLHADHELYERTVAHVTAVDPTVLVPVAFRTVSRLYMLSVIAMAVNMRKDFDRSFFAPPVEQHSLREFVQVHLTLADTKSRETVWYCSKALGQWLSKFALSSCFESTLAWTEAGRFLFSGFDAFQRKMFMGRLNRKFIREQHARWKLKKVEAKEKSQEQAESLTDAGSVAALDAVQVEAMKHQLSADDGSAEKEKVVEAGAGMSVDTDEHEHTALGERLSQEQELDASPFPLLKALAVVRSKLVTQQSKPRTLLQQQGAHTNHPIVASSSNAISNSLSDSYPELTRVFPSNYIISKDNHKAHIVPEETMLNYLVDPRSLGEEYMMELAMYLRSLVALICGEQHATELTRRIYRQFSPREWKSLHLHHKPGLYMEMVKTLMKKIVPCPAVAARPIDLVKIYARKVFSVLLFPMSEFMTPAGSDATLGSAQIFKDIPQWENMYLLVPQTYPVSIVCTNALARWFTASVVCAGGQLTSFLSWNVIAATVYEQLGRQERQIVQSISSLYSTDSNIYSGRSNGNDSAIDQTTSSDNSNANCCSNSNNHTGAYSSCIGDQSQSQSYNGAMLLTQALIDYYTPPTNNLQAINPVTTVQQVTEPIPITDYFASTSITRSSMDQQNAGTGYTTISVVPESQVIRLLTNDMLRDLLSHHMSVKAMLLLLQQLVETVFRSCSLGECKDITVRIFASLSSTDRKSLYLHAHPEKDDELRQIVLTSAGGDVIAASSKNIIRSYASTVFSMGLSLTHPLFSTTLPSLAVKEQDFVKLEQSPPQRLELISASCVTLLAEWMQFGSYISDEDRCAVDWHFWASKAWQALSQVLKNTFICRMGLEDRLPDANISVSASVLEMLSPQSMNSNLLLSALSSDITLIARTLMKHVKIVPEILLVKEVKLVREHIPQLISCLSPLVAQCFGQCPPTQLEALTNKVYHLLSPLDKKSLLLCQFPNVYASAVDAVLKNNPAAVVHVSSRLLISRYALAVMAIAFRQLNGPMDMELCREFPFLMEAKSQEQDFLSQSTQQQLCEECPPRLAPVLRLSAVPGVQNLQLLWNEYAQLMWAQLDLPTRERIAYRFLLPVVTSHASSAPAPPLIVSTGDSVAEPPQSATNQTETDMEVEDVVNGGMKVNEEKEVEAAAMLKPAPSKRRRKSPAVPKAVKTVHMIFLDSVRQRITAANPDLTADEIGRIADTEWALLSAEEKAPFEEKVAKDVVRYKAELVSYICMSPTDNGAATKKAKKDKNAPKNALSNYILFTINCRPDITRQHPDWSSKEIIKELGVRWKALTPDEKAVYENMAKADKRRYETQMAEYKETGTFTAGADLQNSDFSGIRATDVEIKSGYSDKTIPSSSITKNDTKSELIIASAIAAAPTTVNETATGMATAAATETTIKVTELVTETVAKAATGAVNAAANEIPAATITTVTATGTSTGTATEISTDAAVTARVSTSSSDVTGHSPPVIRGKVFSDIRAVWSDCDQAIQSHASQTIKVSTTSIRDEVATAGLFSVQFQLLFTVPLTAASDENISLGLRLFMGRKIGGDEVCGRILLPNSNGDNSSDRGKLAAALGDIYVVDMKGTVLSGKTLLEVQRLAIATNFPNKFTVRKYFSTEMQARIWYDQMSEL